MDSSLEGLIERQENEFIALQAIYGDDFKEEPHPLPKKQGPWAILPAIPRKSRCRISLKGFDLVVELPLRYPEQAPAIRLQRCDPVIRRSLESVVDVKVKELAGKEMIWEVASAVSEYVESHASQLAPSKAQENGETASRELVSNRSSYDLMQKRISEEAEILLQEQKLREERERKRREEEKLAEYNDLYKKVEEELQRKNAAHNPQVVASLMSPVTAGLDSPDNVDSASHNTPQRNGEKPSPEETFHEVELHSVPLDGGGNPSRYLNDFEEINFIGKGGFGQVLKARNRLDGRLYAIKKVLLEPGENATVLREVRALSRLSSPRTVRYYQAWTELLEAASPPGTGSELSEDPESSESSGIVFGNERSVSKISKGTDSACEKFEHLRVTDDSFDDDEEDYDGNAGNPLTPKDWLTVGGRSESFIDVRFDFKRPRTVPDSPPMGNVNQAAARSGSSDTTSPSEEETKTKQAERVLYIQMEFCGDKTLRDIIDSRPLTEQESWLYLRQILEGLAHIHQQGLIHRDLKPQNIFVDDEGNLKIGDFGLATANLQEREVFASVFRSAEDLTARAQTFDIGTALYVAPELRGKQTIKYNHKVDMYSLGIVFFETLYRFSTGMERIVCLQALRQDPISFPADLDHDRLSSQVEIIRSLLSHNPKQRPSAKKLLRSDKLPLSLGLTHLNEALRALTDAKTTYYPMLIKLLFQKNMDMYKDFAYDMDTQNPNSELGNCALYAKLREHMTSIFNRHGAIELNTPLLMLSVGTQPASVKLLDNHGDMVNLPFDLTTPFARYIARSEIIQIKRYSFGTVFRDNPGGGHPREAREVDFDIINSPKTPSGMMEAELITVIDQVLSGFPPTAKRGYHIHFNDMRLLEVIFDICDIRMDPRVLALLENTGRGFSWNQIRHNLINHFGVSKRNVDLLSRFKVEGLLGDLVESLQDVFPISPRVQQVLSELQLIIRYTKDFRTAIKMHWFPLLVHNPNVYSGSFVFQAALNRDIGGTKVLAAGGRYDTLLQKFYHPVLGKKRRGPNVDKRKAVGVHLAIEKFLVMLNEDLNDALQKPTSNSHANSLSGIKESTEAMLLRQWEPRVVEVFVTSFGKGLLEKRLSVIRELWQSGIRAEVLYDTDAVTLDKVISLCTYLGVLFVVLVKKSVVKVKDLRSKHEVEVPFQDLAQWLHRELEEYRGLAPRVAVRGSGLEICDGDGESDDAGQVTVIWDDTESENKKARKQRKGDVSGRAQACVAEAVSRLRKSPTLALSVPKSIVLALSAVNVRHDESFRKLLDAHPIHRRVLQNARSRMLEMLREEGVRFCFLYSNVHDWVEVYHFQDAFGGGGHGKNPVTSS